jgi:hypothetical protein
MMNFNQTALELARLRQEELVAEPLHRQHIAIGRPSIRRSLGHRVIALGQRIAAESPLELARSR